MLLLLQLILRWLTGRVVSDEEIPAQARSKQPGDYTLADIIAMPRGADPLLGIALHHHNGRIAALAVERLAKHEYVRLVALTQEAHYDAREAAVMRSSHDEPLLIEIAIRDDEPELAVTAARLIRSPDQAMRLLQSKYPRVHAIAHTVLESHRLVAHA